MWRTSTRAVRRAALVPVSGYIIVNLEANQQPLSPQAELGWWYQYYFSTDRGLRGYRQNTRDFNKLIWHNASPTWKFDDDTYERSAAAFDNPDHVDIVIHNYRWRLGLAKGGPRYDAVEASWRPSPPSAYQPSRSVVISMVRPRMGLPTERCPREVRTPRTQRDRTQRPASAPGIRRRHHRCTRPLGLSPAMARLESPRNRRTGRE